MKNKRFLLVFVCSILVFSANASLENKSQFQEKRIMTVAGNFDGYDNEDGYSFIIKGEEDDDEEVIYFTEITDEALKALNLKSTDTVGKRFQITYEITEYEETDEEGFTETYEIFKITQLKKF